MSLFSDPLETAQQVNTARLNPINPEDYQAKWYQGIGTGAVKGLGEVGNDVAMFAADTLTPGLRAAAKPIDEHFKTNLDEWLVGEQRKTHDAAKALAPDPRTTGMVGQLVQGFTNIVPEYIAGTAATGSPVGGAAVVYGLQANKAMNRALDEGVDPNTAFLQGQIEGVSAGVGALVPVTLGPALTKSLSTGMRFAANMAFGGASQAATGVATRASVSALLDSRGYADMAQQYKPFESTSLMTDIALGALFGAWGTHAHGPVPELQRHEAIKPSDLDMTMTANNAAHIELGTAPGVPTDVATQNAHVAEVNRAIASLMAGEEFTASEAVTNGNFMDNPAAAETRTAIGDAVREHIGDLEQLNGELNQRGLPDQTLYNVTSRIQTEPIRAKSELGKMADQAVKEGWTTQQLADRVGELVDRMNLRDANKADAALKDRVRGRLWIEERLTRAERLGELDGEQVRLAKWLIGKNPNIANDLALSLPERIQGAAGGYDPVRRLASIARNNSDPLTAAHEFLHHGERLMPDDVRHEIQKAWAAEVKRVTRMAEENGSLDLKLFMHDVLQANLGKAGADERLRDMIRQGLVSEDAYALVNPSEYWAVNASKILKERASESWVQRAIQWVKELVGKVQDIFGLNPDTALVRGLDAVLNSDGRISGDVLAANAPRLDNVEMPGKGVAKENLNGFEPDLRVKVPGKMKLPEKPLVLTGTNLKNAKRQIANIDEIMAKFPDADTSPLEWSKMMAYAMATNDVPIPPYRFLKDINSDGAFKSLSRLSPGQIADASHGFENARQFREAYTNKELKVATTGKLFMWSFLSRGVSPYTQEGLFIDAFPGIAQWINKAAEGKFTEKDFDAYEAWAKSVAPQGSGQPGSGATHNLNAFGKLFLYKMGQKDADGVSLLQKMHTMMEDPEMTGQKIRRWFTSNTEGVGIDNKVVSFTLLVAGFDDVMVLDRVQIRQLWDDGRFNGRNLYDGRKDDGKPVAGSALSEISYGARGLLIYEAVERALAKRIENIYASLGRPDDASIGRYHWETWVADSQQEASHGTLDAILHDAKGDSHMIAEVTAKEGEYGAYAYGARYGRDATGAPYFLYKTPLGSEYKFTVPAFREFMGELKSPKNKVVPPKFKVTEAGNAPWYEQATVNKHALEQLAQRYSTGSSGGEGAGAVRENGQGQAVPDQSRPDRGADPYTPEELMRNAPALTYISEDGTMMSASRALAMADDEITTAQRDSLGYGAAVACALRG